MSDLSDLLEGLTVEDLDKYLSEEEKQALAPQIKQLTKEEWRAWLQGSFEEFVRHFWNKVPGAGEVKWNWHMSLLCRELERVARRVHAGHARLYDLVINVPFGTSKSTIISILFPAWVWTFFPEARFICATHTDRLVIDFAYKTRSVIISDEYHATFPEVELTRDGGEIFSNTRGGERRSCTVGGKTPMGFHAHFLLVDDPIDPQAARSEADLLTASNFMTQVIPSRVVDKAVSTTILVMQRIDFRDPSSVLINLAKTPGATPVRHIKLPGEWTPDIKPPLDEIRKDYPQAYATDNLFDPVRLPRSELKRYEVTLGAFGYAGQILQEPQPPGGGMFKETYFLNRVKAAPYKARRIRAWDRACLIAGTVVETTKGLVAIENIRVGDMVLVRGGRVRRVVWSGFTKHVNRLTRVRFSHTDDLIGTEDHQIWSRSESRWVELQTLIPGDYVLSASGRDSYVLGIETEVVEATPVYDLTVEDDHEFFANGILVHNSTAEGGAYTAGVLMARDEKGDFFVEHVVHGQWEPTERNKIMRATALRDRARYAPHHEPVIYVEDEGGSAGKDANKGVAAALAGFVVRFQKVTGSKDTRAEPWSSQCAAGNVYLVEDNTWDLPGYVQEHVLFRPDPTTKRLGKYKDQVDASSMAFGLLLGLPYQMGQALRVYRIGDQKKKDQLRITILGKEELATAIIESRALLVMLETRGGSAKVAVNQETLGASLPNLIVDGTKGGESGTSLMKEKMGVSPPSNKELVRHGAAGDPPTGDNEVFTLPTETPSQLPSHGVQRLVDHLVLDGFVDLNPQDYQDRWTSPVEPWGLPPADISMRAEHGKKLWAFLLRQRQETWQEIVLVDGGDRTAVSVALSICDALRVPRTCIYFPRDVDKNWTEEKPGNSHVYDVVRLTRNAVVG